MSRGADAASLALEPMRYFSHDSDAREDMKCRYLRSRYGMAGYGRWWVLCEMLAQQRGMLRSKTYPGVARAMAEQWGALAERGK